MFVPHLKTAIHLFSELDVVRTERSIYADAMDQLTLATIVLDENGRVLHANRLAETILAERDGITRVNDSLQLANHDDAKRFRELLTRAIEAQRASKPGLVEVMRVRRPSGLPDIGLVVRPSSSAVGGPDERLTASVAVFLSAETEDAPERAPPSEVIQKLFGLTPKEATLALRLAGGDSLQEASETLGISTNTARAHLRSIFAKTGVDRQAKLVRVLLKSVAMLGQ
jgi:DNA-binding CsgD family transcriptional regulator